MILTLSTASIACLRLAAEGAKLWLDSAKISVAIKNAFDDACAQYYEDLEVARSKKKRSSKEQSTIDKEELDGPAALHRPSPLGIAKAIKNDAELEGMRQAHLRYRSCLLRSVGLWSLPCCHSCFRLWVLKEYNALVFELISLMLLQGCCCTF